MKKIASVLAANFKHWGLQHVFGIPGKAISPILFELLNEDIEFVLSKHEAAAGFEAAGYALMNDKIGVAIGISGPGGTNLITAAGGGISFTLAAINYHGASFYEGHWKGFRTGFQHIWYRFSQTCLNMLQEVQ